MGKRTERQSMNIKPNSENSRQNKLINKKGLTTFLLFLSSLIISFSGIALYISPKKHAPIWAKGLLWGLDKDQWKEIHTVVSLLFIIVAIIHLYLNWRVFRNYIKSRIKEGINLRRELAIACLIIAVFVGGTIMQVPPFHTVIEARESLKDYFKKYEKQHKNKMRRLMKAQGKIYKDEDDDDDDDDD